MTYNASALLEILCHSADFVPKGTSEMGSGLEMRCVLGSPENPGGYPINGSTGFRKGIYL